MQTLHYYSEAGVGQPLTRGPQRAVKCDRGRREKSVRMQLRKHVAALQSVENEAKRISSEFKCVQLCSEVSLEH